LDVYNTLEGYLFVGTKLSVLPKFGPEEMNIAAVVDRQVHMEAAVRELSSNFSAFKPDSAEIEQRLNAFETAISSQLEKLTALSDQLTATATLVKDFEVLKPSSTSMSRVKVKDVADDEVDKVDRSRNVIIFGIDEVTDTTDGTAWRDTVIQTLSTAAGRDVIIDDAFRLGRTVTTGRKRPVLVRLHSAWDRRIILSGSWKLSRKAGFERIFVTPDEPVEIRRQKICDRLVKRATTRGQSVSVDNGILSIDNQAVFSLERGFLRNDG